jgi:hypothetical protein
VDSSEPGQVRVESDAVVEQLEYAGMLVTDVAAAPVRATRDVDVIVEVLTLADYRALERELEKAGFSHDRSPEAPICRWIVGTSLLELLDDVRASASQLRAYIAHEIGVLL